MNNLFNQGCKRFKKKTNTKNKMFATGKLIINEFGNGFVNLDDKIIYIKKTDIQNAYHGENVEVEYEERDNLYFGKVIHYSLVGKIFVGVVHHFFKDEIYILCHELTKSKLIIIKTDTSLNKNDWVKIMVLSDEGKIYGELLGTLPNDLDTIIQSKFNLDEIKSIGVVLDKTNTHIDQTDLDTFTIDPENSRDCDDAFSIKMIDNKIHIYVHISDVAHFINPDSPDFDLIIGRGNTKYGVNNNWPMIPREYSENICSILPEKNTFVATNEFIYTDDNRLEYVGFYYSIVRSKNKYSYEEVDSNFDNFNFKTIYETALLIKKEIPDIIMCKETNSHLMIRYWMIKINILMCNELFRCNPTPNENKFKIIKKYLQINNREELLEKIDNEDMLTNYLLKKLMIKAYYTTEENWHFGLGIDNYTHWTSPIRRACDLLNHCIVKGYEIDLRKYMEYLNINEAIQDDIENFIEEVNRKVNVDCEYEGTVIGISKTGVIIFVPELYNKYMIHISKLSNEKLDYINDELVNDNMKIKLFDKIKTKIT